MSSRTSPVRGPWRSAAVARAAPIDRTPRRDRTRDWIHNITANPHVTVHLKQGVEADIPAMARVITDPHEARPLIEAAARRWRRDDVDDMIAHSPLIALTPTTPPAA